MDSSIDQSRSRPKPIFFGFILLIALISGSIAGLWLRGEQPRISDIAATVLEPAKTIEDFTLITHLNTPFTLESLKEKWSFLFFGYIHCPDVCPTTLHTLTQVSQTIAETDQNNTQVVFVSVDPQRDTAERLAQYVPYFDASFIGVTGDQANIDQLTEQLGILHLRVESEDAGNYLMDHTASILLINPSGQLRALFSAPHQISEIVEDFSKITQL